MKYTKENIVGVTFIAGGDKYNVFNKDGTIFLKRVKDNYDINYSSCIPDLLTNCNKGTWKVIDQTIQYEIY